MTEPRITIITFAWPPRNSIGAHRPYSWAKYWSEAGAKVRVLTACKYDYDAPLDLTLPALPNVEVIETDYATSSTNAVALIAKSPLGGLARNIYQKIRGAGKSLTSPRAAWLNAALPHVSNWAKDTDFVVSTYDPSTVHQLASAMKQANSSIFWVADYRDLWSLNHAPAWTEEQRAQQTKLELETVEPYVDLVISVSDELSESQGALVKSPWLTITNGFDVSLDGLESALEDPSSPSRRPLRVVYTGKIYKGHRDPTPLLKAIANLAESGKIRSDDFIVDIYGGQTDGIEDILDSGPFRSFVNLHGHVTREKALKAQKAADLLLLLESSQADAQGVLTGKIFEYIATGKPVLSLGSTPGSAIYKLLNQTKTGMCAGEDTKVIENLLLNLISRERVDWFKPEIEKIQIYSREKQALKLLDAMRMHRDKQHAKIAQQ